MCVDDRKWEVMLCPEENPNTRTANKRSVYILVNVRSFLLVSSSEIIKNIASIHLQQCIFS